MPRPAAEHFRLVIEALLERPTAGTYALAITRATHLANATAGAVLRQLEEQHCDPAIREPFIAALSSSRLLTRR